MIRIFGKLLVVRHRALSAANSSKDPEQHKLRDVLCVCFDMKNI